MRAAMEYMEAGADAIYTPRRHALVKMLADEGIPVMGHLGLVPRKCTWVGGLRAIGTTAAERRPRGYEASERNLEKTTQILG